MPSRLAQHLVHRGLLPVEKAQEAVRQLAVTGGGLDTVLLEHAMVSEAALLQMLGEISTAKAVQLADFEPNAEVAPLIPPKIADRLCVVPLSVDGAVLHVACCYPLPRKELDEIAFLLGKQLELWVGLEVRIRDWIQTLYKIPLPARFASLLAALDPNRPLPTPSISPPPPPAASTRSLVEETTLEDALTREMVDRIARAVAEEPIPLEVVKRAGRTDAVAARPPPPPPEAMGRTATPPPDSARPEPAQRTEATPNEVARRPVAPGATSPESPSPATAPTSSPAASAPHPSTRAESPSRPTGAPPSRGTAAMPAWRTVPPAAPADPPAQKAPPVTVAPAPAPAKAAAPAPAPRENPDRDVVPEWTLEQARGALKQATHERDQIMDVALRFARRTFDFVAAFAVIRGAAVGWDARGERADVSRLSQVSIPLDATSVFRTVAMTRGSYVGPLPPDALSKHYLEQMGRTPPRTVFLFPVEVKARLVAIIYGDSGGKPVSQRRLSDLLLLCQELPGAFQELIVFRKQRTTAVEGTRATELFTAPAATGGLGWSPSAPEQPKGLGRIASMATLVQADAERPPPDFAPILRRLTGPDAVGRARAIAELARSPEASSKVLASNFPGPTAWSRLPVVELPEADELGPIPGALARLGRPAAVALAPLLDSNDPETRYFALLTAGNLPFAELVDGVLRGLFDLEPDISSAARAAATALRKLPRFDSAMRDLRQELAARDSIRRTLAARALGALRDKEAIEGLIGLTGSDDQMCAQAAAEALRDITKASYGPTPRQWTAWWAENRGRRRVDWLLAALRHPELETRMSAIDELAQLVGDNMGYVSDAEPADREAAVRRWEAALSHEPRFRRLE